MKIILIGPPCTGKETIAQALSDEFNLPHISTGDMLRSQVAAETNLGLTIKHLLEAGQFVEDDIMNAAVHAEIANLHHYILDGYPRTLSQAQFYLELVIRPVIVVHIDTPRHILLERAKERQRADDKVIETRIKIYENVTKPVISLLNKSSKVKLLTVKGRNGPAVMDDVIQLILNLNIR